jgi:hypothetical protein
MRRALLLFSLFPLLAHQISAEVDACNKDEKEFVPNPVQQPVTRAGRMSVDTTVSEYKSCDVTVNPDDDACKCPCGSELITVSMDFSGAEQCLNSPPKTPPVSVPADLLEFAPNTIPGLWGWWDAGDTDGDGLLDNAGRGEFPRRWDAIAGTCTGNSALTTEEACAPVKPFHKLTSWADKSGNARHFECPDALTDKVRVRHNSNHYRTDNSWAWSSYSPLTTCGSGNSNCCPNGKNADGGNKCIYQPMCPFIKDRRWKNVAKHRPAVAAQSYAPTANYGAMKATDGSSVWYNDANICFRVDTGNWIRIDLGKERRISHIRFQPSLKSSIYLTARIGNTMPSSTGSTSNPICGEPTKEFKNVRPDSWTCTSGTDSFMRGRWIIIHSSTNNFYGCEIEAFEDTRHADSTVALEAGSRRPVVRFEGYNQMTLKKANQAGSTQTNDGTCTGNRGADTGCDATLADLLSATCTGTTATGIGSGSTSCVWRPWMEVPRPFTIISIARYAGKYRGRIVASHLRDLRHGFWGGRQNVFHNHQQSWSTATERGEGFVEDGAMEGPFIMHTQTSNTSKPWELNWRMRDYRDSHERSPKHHFYTNGIETSDQWYMKWQWGNKRYTGDPGRIQLGMAYSRDDRSGYDSSHAEVAEMMIFDRNISDVERQGLERYLARKWNIVTLINETHAPEYVAAEANRTKTCSQLNWPDMSSAAVDADGQDCHTRTRGEQYCSRQCPCGDEDGWSHGDRQRCKKGASSHYSTSCDPKYGFVSQNCQPMCLAFPELKKKLQETCARGDGCDPNVHGFLDKDDNDNFDACDSKGCPSPATEYKVSYSDAVSVSLFNLFSLFNLCRSIFLKCIFVSGHTDSFG